MTKRQLLEAINHCDDNDVIVVEVHDMTLSEDLYDVYIDIIPLDGGFLAPTRREIRVCPVNHYEEI